MLKQLKYSVTFPTGRAFNETVLFQGGFGAITGPNEAGKSLILEMIRFCLFGSAALRGKADDYKTLKAELVVVVKGETYLIERTSTKAKITRGEEILATGIKPVNLKVIQILGFNLDVFDMGCAANQDKLLELGAMQPTDRRRRVDSVIGVAILDDLAKLAGEEALALKRAADDLTSNLIQPREPVKPADYRPIAELQAEKQALDAVRSEADQLRGWLSNEKRAPAKPVDKIGMGSEVLQGLLDQQTARKVERQVLEAEMARIPALARVVTSEELDEEEERHRLANQYRARRQFLTFHPKPEFSIATLNELASHWVAYDRWKRIETLLSKQEDLARRGEHTCPSCQHHWPIACEELEVVDGQIEAIRQEGTFFHEEPQMSRADLEKHQRTLDNWDEAEWAKHKDAPEVEPKTTMTVDQIVAYRAGLAGKARREELAAQIQALKPAEKEPDYAAMLRERQQYEAQLSVWSEQVAQFEAWQAERQQKLVRLTMLDVDLQGYPALLEQLEAARIYDAALVSYQGLLEAYNKAAGQVAAYRADADDWNKVKTALVILRSKIKSYLVPSLNRVASSLIHHMTGGDRQTVEVDEDFNILVDGQSIDTLSGSGKAVANLSLRIGLGQVLTNNVLSLFIGDEIDASMDKNRSEKTASVVHTLKDRISQLLLVSHKSPAADYSIAVGETFDHQHAETY